VLRHDGVFAVPKASSPDHVRENAGALKIRLDADDLKLLDDEFPPPQRPAPLPLY
jgi:diketogulonate reductase-like aldo/keto reductase